MTARSAFAIALVTVAGLLPGCGGGNDEPQSDRARIRDVVEQFDAAFSGGDYGKVCELLHSRRRQQLEFGRGQKCADILESAAETESRLIDALADAKITYVTITKGNEDFATVGVEGPSIGARQAELLRDGERGWRVSESPAGL